MGLIAVALLAGGGAAAPADETPVHFTQRVFAIYRTGGAWWSASPTPAAQRALAAYQKRVYADFYDPEFVRLMNENGALAGKKGGGVDLDYDPVCQCQDSGGAYAYVSGARRGGFFDARVRDTESKTPWTLVLQTTPRGWRIYDVVDSTGSVRTWLGRHNACLKVAKTEAQAGKCVS